MKNILLLSILIIVLAACKNENKTVDNTVSSVDSITNAPSKSIWFATGNRTDYNTGIEHGSGRNGSNAGIVKSRITIKDDFGAMMQWTTDTLYNGKRIRMSAYLKTKDVSEGAGLWLRADLDSVTSVFDNMKDGKTNRQIKGTNDWAQYSIVIDVPENTFAVAYGALLNGSGEIWFDDFAFEVVDNTVPTTGVLITGGERITNEDKALTVINSYKANFLPANSIAQTGAPSNLNFDE